MSVQTDRSRDGTGREGEASESNEPSFCDFRVRSVIILQDKPHDRERLLLKFLKIMKVVRVRSRKSPFVSSFVFKAGPPVGEDSSYTRTY